MIRAIMSVTIIMIITITIMTMLITSLLMEQNLESAPMQRKTCSSDGFPWEIAVILNGRGMAAGMARGKHGLNCNLNAL